MPGSTAEGRDRIDALIAAMAAAGESPPFSDQALVDARAGQALILDEPAGAAVLRGPELELAVMPEARGRGVGTALVRRALAVEPPPTLAWAHGDHPAAAALAIRFGWHAERVLLQLRAHVPPSSPATSGGDGSSSSAASGGAPGALRQTDGRRVEAFRPGADEHAWLDLNAAAFAHHPEQGAMTLADLLAREAEAWFQADDLLLLRDTDREAPLAGSCWLKIADGIGEFYAVAVRPDLQGTGIGTRLMSAGFDRLRERGMSTAALYVEADNRAALALYRRSGFTEYARDVQYRAPVDAAT